MIDTTAALVHTPRDSVKAAQAEARQNLWQYGLLLMMVALVAESFVGRA